MGRTLKTTVVLAALAVLVLVPVVEANYMVGYPYVGTAPKTHESRRWALSGFYEGREMMPSTRPARVGPRASVLSMRDGETSYGGMKSLMSGTRCLGCELGAYQLGTPRVRRGRYYISISEVSGRSKFVYTGGAAQAMPTGTYGSGGKRMLLRKAAARSRLGMSEKDLAMLHGEASAMLDGGYQLRTGRRCLSCEFETGKRLGRYYATTSEVQEVKSYVPLQENK
jgi:hypothetical protein